MSRRNWAYFPALGGVSILYRIDNPANTQIWLYESGEKKLIKEYPLVSVNINTLALVTHINGSTSVPVDITTGYRQLNGTLVAYLYNAIGFIINPITSNVNNGVVGTNVPSSAAGSGTGTTGVGATGFTAAASGDAINGFVGDVAIQDFGASASSSSVVTYEMPPGEYEANATLTVTSSVPVNTSNTPSADFPVPTTSIRFSDFGFGLNFGASPPDAVSSITSNAFASPQGRIQRWNRSRYPSLELGGSGGFAIGEVGNFIDAVGESVTLDYSLSLDSLALNNHRPVGYLSKTTSQRYIGVRYLNALGQSVVDYFIVDADLNVTTRTWLNTDIPNTEVLDQQRSLLSHSASDFLLGTAGNPFWARDHKPAVIGGGGSGIFNDTTNNLYNILPDKRVVSFNDYNDAVNGPKLNALIQNDIPEANTLLWVAALPHEASTLDSANFTVVQY